MIRIYKIEFEISVDQIWFDDGLDAKVLKRRIKDELPSNLCSYANENELFIKKIKVYKVK